MLNNMHGPLEGKSYVLSDKIKQLINLKTNFDFYERGRTII